MRDEIQAGLRNAIERGFSLENAIQSFIGAGYNPVEVKEAAKSLSTGIVPITQQGKKAEDNSATKAMTGDQMNSAVMNSFTNASPFSDVGVNVQQSLPQTQSSQARQVAQIQQISPKQSQSPVGQIQPKSGSTTKWIILIALILLLLLGIVGLVLYFSGSLTPLLNKISGGG